MNRKDAFYLLFVHHFEEGPLFKNQIDLVNELINTPESAYYTPKTNADEYAKGVSRLKAYLSQLFSEEAKRNITTEFRISLQVLLTKKFGNPSYSTEILNEILTDLREKNMAVRYLPTLPSKKGYKSEVTFFESILEGSQISIFTTREIIIEFNLLNRKQSLVELLLEDLLISLKENKRIKKYRFNFPLNQTCVLFWQGFEKTITNYLMNNIDSLSFILPIISHSSHSNPLEHIYNKVELDKNKNSLQRVSKYLLSYLSNNHIINVFHLPDPVYLTPSIIINPNDPLDANGYLFLQSSSSGEDEIHKLTPHELLLWRFFVWEKLKINKSGKLIEYNEELSN